MDDALRRAQAFFGDKAEAYRASASHGDAADLARMVAWLAPLPGARALDVATGGGHAARALAAAGCRVVTSDATRAMAPHVVCDAQALCFASASFDVVASRIAPHHFPDLDAFAKEAARVLVPGGALYVFDLTTPEDAETARMWDHVERLRDPSHVHSWSPAEWRAALAGAGLAVERLETPTSAFPLEPWLARAKMAPAVEDEVRGLVGRLGLARDGVRYVRRVEVLAKKGGPRGGPRGEGRPGRSTLSGSR